MIKKIVVELMKIIIILFICQLINIPTVKAGYWDDIVKDANKFIDDGQQLANKDNAVDDEKVKETTDKIYNTLLAAGIVLSVIVGGILGIQIMWGSIEQQIKAKEMLLPYVAGCSAVFGAFGIWKICITIFSQL